MSFIGEKLLEHSRAIARLDRQAVTQRMSGKVSEGNIDFEKRRVRLVLGQDPATGEEVLSPWVKIQSQSAGGHKSFVMPSGGEQMYLESEGGRVGANSLARYGAHDDENPHPQSNPKEWTHQVGNAALFLEDGRFLAKAGSSSLSMTDGQWSAQVGGNSIIITDALIVLTAAGSAIRIAAGLIRAISGLFRHNSKNIGDSHTNSGLPVD